MAEFEKITAGDELEPGGRKSIIVDERSALLIRVGNEYFAIEDVCTHDGQPLTDGPISGTEITCPRHGARFDVKTGRPLCMPATQPLPVFDVEVRDDGVYVKPDE